MSSGWKYEPVWRNDCFKKIASTRDTGSQMKPEGALGWQNKDWMEYNIPMEWSFSNKRNPIPHKYEGIGDSRAST